MGLQDGLQDVELCRGRGRGVGGPSVLVRAWEVLGGKRGEREECVVLTFVEKYLCSRGGSRKTRCLPEKSSSRAPWCLFEQDSLCLCSRSPPLSQNGFPLRGTCCHVENLCISFLCISCV